jgi:hypothetical protein
MWGEAVCLCWGYGSLPVGPASEMTLPSPKLKMVVLGEPRMGVCSEKNLEGPNTGLPSAVTESDSTILAVQRVEPGQRAVL